MVELDMDSQRPSSSRTRVYRVVPSQATLHPNMDVDYIIHPGLIDDSVLTEQRTHRTEVVWNKELDPKGKAYKPLKEVCEKLLGVYPDCYNNLLAIAKRSWFKNYLSEIPLDADEEALKKYARAYFICLLGPTLFADKSGKTISLYFLPLLEDLNRVMTYSWRSAVLAYPYSQLCSASKIGHSQIGGAPLIIQF
ncbi:hypothetical protein QQ045_001005 [Rhodiola kirilowii]